MIEPTADALPWYASNRHTGVVHESEAAQRGVRGDGIDREGAEPDLDRPHGSQPDAVDREGAERLAHALRSADAVLVGAGAGLSASDGDHHSGPVFETRFADLIARYGYSDAYTGGFHPYPGEPERWAFWARNITLQRYESGPGRVYADLLALLTGHDAFVLTTNVDHRFQTAGLDRARLFYTQGDYGLLQCSVPCTQETYDARPYVEAMTAAMDEGGDATRVPEEALPRRPRCGAPMTTNLRADDRFVQDEGWYAAARRYGQWLEEHAAGRVLHLELGVGFNTPGIIKYPFWQRVHANPEAVYAPVDLNAAAPREIAGRSIVLRGDIGRTLAAVHEAL